MRKLREWMNVQSVKNPEKLVLGAILLFNIAFFLIASAVISGLSLSGTERMGFFEAAFCTITMILDAGCIQFVVEDIGAAGVTVVIVCLAIVLIGMISFTGAVIGYITNYISGFVDNAGSSVKKLRISDHAVILNWNTRASEIINDLLYCPTKQRVVVLVSSRKDEIEREIAERLADTIAKENALLRETCHEMSFLKRAFYLSRHKFKSNLTVIVREGDVFSYKQLRDISLEHARMIVILGSDINNTVCKFEHKDLLDERGRGNSLTVKTLMQVADITAAQYSDDNQKIIVEITDEWTAELVDKIIRSKQVDGKCNIVPVNVNQILGHLLSQFSLMPELNSAYRELFSNKGAAFYTKELTVEDEQAYAEEFFAYNRRALPLTSMVSNGVPHFYYASASEKDIDRLDGCPASDYAVKLNREYWIERKNVIILGHNTRCDEIMKGFEAFCCEWGYADKHDQILRVIVVDDQKHLERMNFYKQYPFVIETVAAEIYDRDLICETIDNFVSHNTEDTSVLILSDDAALNENIDANALANLVYVQDIIRDKMEDPSFDPGSIDVIVEIIDPKHHDVVNSYSVNNVVISNRYISKMITQIGEKEALFDFYSDVLTYDTGDAGEYDSKEIYIKKVRRYFDETPAPTTADRLIRAVYASSVEENNPTVVLGYVKPNGAMTLFSGDQTEIPVSLGEKDKLILFSSH